MGTAVIGLLVGSPMMMLAAWALFANFSAGALPFFVTGTLCGTLLLFVVARGLTKPYATRFPGEFATVGASVQGAISLNFGKICAQPSGGIDRKSGRVSDRSSQGNSASIRQSSLNPQTLSATFVSTDHSLDSHLLFPSPQNPTGRQRDPRNLPPASRLLGVRLEALPGNLIRIQRIVAQQQIVGNHQRARLACPHSLHLQGHFDPI